MGILRSRMTKDDSKVKCDVYSRVSEIGAYPLVVGPSNELERNRYQKQPIGCYAYLFNA